MDVSDTILVESKLPSFLEDMVIIVLKHQSKTKGPSIIITSNIIKIYARVVQQQKLYKLYNFDLQRDLGALENIAN